MGEEILDQLDVVGGQRHQIAGAAAREIGRRQRVELAEGIDAHLGQQAEGHVVGQPGFEPVQDAGDGCEDGQCDGEVAIGLVVLEGEHDQRREHADADEGNDARHAQDEGGGELALPRHDDLHQCHDDLVPGQAFGLDDAFGDGLHRAARGAGDRLGALGGRERIERDIGLLLARLFGHELRIDAALAHQLGMLALLGDMAAVEHEDAVAIDDAGQAVRQDERRAALHQPVERFLDHRLVLGIDGGQGLVEHQDRRVAQQRAGDGHPLALAAGELDALFADDGRVALRQALDEVVNVGGPGRVLHLLARGARPAEADILLDRAVEQERVLVHDRDQRADLRKGQRAQIVAAQQDAALIGIVEAQQQAHDRRLAAARGADEAQPLASGRREVQPLVHGAARAGIGEAHVLEGNGGRQQPIETGRRRVDHRRRVVEDAVDALRGGEADHALVQHRAQLAHRPEDLDAQHQDDQQRGERHGTGLDPRGAVDQRRRRAARDRRVGDAARQRVGAQHPHGAAEQIAGFPLELVGAGLALAERLQRRQPLDRIEELGGERFVGRHARDRGAHVPFVPEGRGEQRDQREAQHDQCHRQVDEGDHGEDQKRRQQRDQELRQELPEIGFELLDAVDHGEGEAAGALPADRCRAERGDLVVERAAQHLLDPRGRLVRQHGAPVFGHAAQHHHPGDQQDRQHEVLQRPFDENLADQPAEKAEPGDAAAHAQKADGDGGGDAGTHALGEDEEAGFDVHDAMLGRTPVFVSPHFGKPAVHF